MYKIINKRCSGKTKELMELAKDKNVASFICQHPFEMQRKAYEYGIAGISFVSYEEFLFELEKSNNQNFFYRMSAEGELFYSFVIDDIDIFFYSLAMHPDLKMKLRLVELISDKKFIGYTLTDKNS